MRTIIRTCALAVAVFICLTACGTGKIPTDSNKTSLSEEEILLLRETYPTYGSGMGLITFSYTFEELLSEGDCYVVEVIEELEPQYVKLKLPQGVEADEVLAQDVEYFAYTAKIVEAIQDNEYGLKPGDEILVLFSSMGIGLYRPEIGQSYLTNLLYFDRTGQPGYDFNALLTYYVTPEGYVLSTFKGAAVQEDYTGLRLDKMVETVQTIYESASGRKALAAENTDLPAGEDLAPDMDGADDDAAGEEEPPAEPLTPPAEEDPEPATE